MSGEPSSAEELYLHLLKGCLTRSIFPERYRACRPRHWLKRAAYTVAEKLLAARELALVRAFHFDSDARREGNDWPAEAETMIGTVRLDNLQACIVDVLRRGVPGDLIETGVWRGGAAILMRAVLKVYRDTQRVVWAADSFQGLPRPDSAYRADRGDRHWTFRELRVPLEEVKHNFAKYGLLDEQVRFLAGWFRDTLPTAPIETLAVLRLDGDMYESTVVALDALYPKLSVGGYVIVDDYGAVPGCKLAVDGFRQAHGIVEPVRLIDPETTYSPGVFWQREDR